MASFSNFKSSIVQSSQTAAGVSSGGVTVYDSADLLPYVGNESGDQAFVNSNNRLYIWQGSGWYNVALINRAPSISSVQDSDGNTTPFTLSNEGAVTTITITAADSDGDPITYSATADSDFNGLASITNDGNEFTITPFSSDSASTASGTITFKATDGVNIASSGVQTFTLTFLSALWSDVVLSIGASGSGWNLSGAVSTGTNISLSSIAEHFSSDGLTLITVNSSTQVGSHDLSTAYDMSTITASQAYNILGETSLEDARFSSDGTKMYVVGISNDTVYQYSLSTAYDVSTASYDSVSFAVGGQESAPRAMAFKPDGTKMYITGNSGDDINEYDLSTAWDLSTASYSQVFTYGIQGTPLHIEFSPDGTKLFVYGSSSSGSHPLGSGIRVIDRWDLSTAWDISTMAYHSSLADPISDNVQGMTFNNDGTTLYVSTTTVVDVFDMSANTNSNFIDRSTNYHTVTPTGSPTQTAFHPYLDNWSVEFDGSGDYLELADNDDWHIGASDFTIEAWVNKNTSAVSNLISNRQAGTAEWRILLDTDASGAYDTDSLRFDFGSSFVTFSATIPNNEWYHLALVRSGTTGTLYINGSSVGTNTISNFSNFSGDLIIGSQDGSGEFYKGYISNLRLINGTALYTSNFTPPTEKLTAVSGTVLLTCQSNRFIDNSSTAHAITVNGDTKVSAFNPFGQESEYAVGENKGGVSIGSGNYLTTEPSIPATADFTLECWIYPTDITAGYSQNQGIYGQYQNSGSNLFLFYMIGGVLRAFGDSGTIVAGTTFKNNEWYHIAMVRSSGSDTIYINGSSENTGYIGSISQVYDTLIGFFIVESRDYYFRGTISDLKVTNSALYTSNFTPPTAPVGNTNADLYLPMDNAGVYDKTGSTDITLETGSETSASVTKYASSSIYIPAGTTNNVRFTHPPVGQDFTYEFWFYPLSLVEGGTYGVPFSIDNGLKVTTMSTGKIRLWWSASGFKDGTTVLSINNWYHIAVVKSATNSSVKLYLNGTLEINWTDTATAYTHDPSGEIGALGYFLDGFGHNYDGYVENVQILDGEKYTANFTAPTEEQGIIYQGED